MLIKLQFTFPQSESNRTTYVYDDKLLSKWNSNADLKKLMPSLQLSWQTSHSSTVSHKHAQVRNEIGENEKRVNTQCMLVDNDWYKTSSAAGWHYSQTHSSRQHWELIISTHLGRVFTYTYFILYAVSKWDQASDIHLSDIHIHLRYPLIYAKRQLCKQTKNKPYTNRPDDGRINTYTHLFNSHFFGTTQVSRYQKGKTIWIY